MRNNSVEQCFKAEDNLHIDEGAVSSRQWGPKEAVRHQDPVASEGGLEGVISQAVHESLLGHSEAWTGCP